MGNHRVKTARCLQPFRCCRSFQVDANVDALFGGWLNDGALFVASQADVGFLGRDLDVLSKFLDDLDNDD